MESALPFFVVVCIGTFIMGVVLNDIPVLKYLPGFRRWQQKRLKAQGDELLQQYGLVSREEGIAYARKAFEREDYEAAAEFCSRILAVYVLDAEALYLRACACCRLGEHLAALQDLNALVQRAPDFVHGYALRAEVQLKLKNPAAALEDMNRGFALGTPNSNAYLTRASAYAHLNNFAEAIKDINHVIEAAAQPTAGLYNNLGWYHSLAGQYPEALANLNKALDHDSKYVYGYGSRGHTYFLMGKYPEALADFVKSAELKRDHTFAIAGQSITQHALGNIEAAQKSWRRLIELDPRYASADALIEDYHPAEAFVNEARKIIEALNQS